MSGFWTTQWRFKVLKVCLWFGKIFYHVNGWDSFNLFRRGTQVPVTAVDYNSNKQTHPAFFFFLLTLLWMSVAAATIESNHINDDVFINSLFNVFYESLSYDIKFTLIFPLF